MGAGNMDYRHSVHPQYRVPTAPAEELTVRTYHDWWREQQLQELYEQVDGDCRMFLLVLQYAKARVPPTTRSWGGLALLECANYRIPDTFGLTATS